MRLLVISSSARFIAQSAKRAGYCVVAIDQFADWDLQVVSDKNCRVARLVDWRSAAKENSIDWDLAIYGGGFECLTDEVFKLEQSAKLLGAKLSGASAFQLKRLTEFQSFALVDDLARRSGGALPQTKGVLSEYDNPHQWVRKPIAGFGGIDVRLATELDREIDANTGVDHESMTRPFVFQKFVNGENYSATFARFDDTQQSTRMIGVTRQLVGNPEFGAASFGYAGSIGPIPTEQLTSFVVDTFMKIGSAVGDEFQLAGVFGIDFVVAETGDNRDREINPNVYLIDINPRIPASAEVIEIALDQNRKTSDSFPSPESLVSIVGIHLDACAGQSRSEQMELKTDSDTRYGKAILFSKSDAPIVINDSIFESLRRRHCSNPQIVDCWIADIPNPGTIIATGEPIVSLFVRAKREQELYNRMVGFAAELRRLIET